MSNIDTLREGYAAYGRRDFGFVDTMFGAEVEWTVVGTPVGTLHGRDAVKAFFGDLAEQFDAHTIELVDTVESGDRLVAWVDHAFTSRDGIVHHVTAVHDWTWHEGRVTRMREVADTMAFAVAAGMAPAQA